MFWASDPVWGSVKAYEKIISPVAAGVRYLRFCASVPKSTIPLMPIERCARASIPRDMSRLASVSTTCRYWFRLNPLPPYSRGTVRPKKLLRPSFSNKSAGTIPCSSRKDGGYSEFASRNLSIMPRVVSVGSKSLKWLNGPGSSRPK